MTKTVHLHPSEEFDENGFCKTCSQIENMQSTIDIKEEIIDKLYEQIERLESKIYHY